MGPRKLPTPPEKPRDLNKIRQGMLDAIKALKDEEDRRRAASTPSGPATELPKESSQPSGAEPSGAARLTNKTVNQYSPIAGRKPTAMPFSWPSAKKATQKNFDIFNYVSDDSNLTFENIYFLLRVSLVRMGFSEGMVDKIFDKEFTAIPVSKDDSLDKILKEVILNFFGREDAKEKFTIYMCEGEVDDEGKSISNGHWSTLHIRKNGNKVAFYHADSLADKIPAAIARVIDSLAADNLDPLSKELRDRYVLVSALKRTALENLKKFILAQPISLNCSKQYDANSCGYHSIFNGLVMHYIKDYMHGDEIEWSVQQDEEEKNVTEFVEERSRELENWFNKDIKKTSSEMTEYIKHLINPRKYEVDFDSILKDRDKAISLRDSIITSNKLTALDKLSVLIRIEEKFKEEDISVDKSLLEKNLFALDLPKFYKKFLQSCILEMTQNLKNHPSISAHNLDEVFLNLTSERNINKLNEGKIKIFRDFFNERTGKNFDELQRSLGIVSKYPFIKRLYDTVPNPYKLHDIVEDDEVGTPNSSVSPRNSRRDSLEGQPLSGQSSSSADDCLVV